MLDLATAPLLKGKKALVTGIAIGVGFLATDAAKLITGETLYIDGGYHIID
jgi:enoyl-[acyl-carrier protein] reductase I